MTGHIRIGTRGSALALAQAEQAADQLVTAGVFESYELVVIKTTGDRIQDRSLAEIGGKGLFIKEIEEALLDRRVALAIHSMKDLPGFVAPGTVLEGALPRADPSDTLITRNGENSLQELPKGACLGTSSLRRQFQAKVLRPDLKVVPLRGNVDTRLRKLNEPQKQFDATLLATAGLSRLGRDLPNAQPVPVNAMLPAIAQGTLGFQVREGDSELRAALEQTAHRETLLTTRAERSLLRALSGSCKVPLAGYARMSNAQTISLEGRLGRPDGSVVVQAKAQGEPGMAEQLGKEVANQLMSNGGERLLHELGIQVNWENLK